MNGIGPAMPPGRRWTILPATVDANERLAGTTIKMTAASAAEHARTRVLKPMQRQA